jgi:hypothetical protein
MKERDLSMIRLKAPSANQVNKSAFEQTDHYKMYACYFRKVPGVRVLLLSLHEVIATSTEGFRKISW